MLRRVIRRAIQHGRGLGLEPGFPAPLRRRGRPSSWVAEYPELSRQSDLVHTLADRLRRRASGRTLEQGLKRLDELIARARDSGRRGDCRRRRLPAARHLRLPDRHDARDRRRARARGRRGGVRGPDGRTAHARPRLGPDAGSGRSCASGRTELAGSAGFETEFIGYERTDAETTIGAAVAAGRPAAAQAGRVPVLRHGWRPDRRRGHDRV